jgi:mannose-1-phosphate guanylyltransferase
MSGQNRQVWGIILAGGEGKRLQSFIQARYGSDTPKQYCAFTGTRSMLRHTIDRAELFIQPERLLTLVSKQHFRYTHDQLADRPSGTVIVQPIRRETGPAILYPLLHVYQRNPEAIVCLFPSDHFVLNEQSFMKHIEFASEFVSDNPQSILLLGVIPQEPEGEYGWIVTGEEIACNSAKRVYTISRFVEKPDASTAHRLYQNGSLWNTMVVVSRAKTLLTLFETFTPTVYQAFWEIRDVLGLSCEARIVEEVFSKLPPMNFSYSILEKNPVGLRAVKVEGVYWSDWGDAARIQRDINHFCTERAAHVVPLHFAKMSGAAVFAPKDHESVDTLGIAAEEKFLRSKIESISAPIQ